MNDKLKNVVEVFRGQTAVYTKEIKSLEDKIKGINEEYKEHLIREFKDWIKESSRFFKTNDGYFAVDSVTDASVVGLDSYHPRIFLKGFYVRGIDCQAPARFLYGYYDVEAGFLLNELMPVSQEVFCEKVRDVVEDIISNLQYKPTHLYRKEGDRLDKIISDARKAKVDIDYYPEVEVTIIE